MTTCLLVRHGQSEANVGGTLAGHLDVALTAAGTDQATRVATALTEVPLAAVITSPLLRCRSTAEAICAYQGTDCQPRVDDAFAEVRYGAWTGRSIKELAEEDLWRTVQSSPSQVTFPPDPSGEHCHESMTAMAERVWAGWDTWERRLREEHGEQAVWVVVSHGDVIKALLARALGLELDAFQSIVVDPGSVSIVHRHDDRTAVTAMNLRDDVYARLAASVAARDKGAEGEGDDVAGGTSTDTGPSVGVVGGGNA